MIARNSIPAIGVIWFDWPAALAIFQIWFDGVAALAAMFALQVRAFGRLDPEFAKIPAVFSWAVMMLIIGIPYWFMIVGLSTAVLPGDFWTVQLRDTVVLGALGAVLVANIVDQSRRGYGRMTEKEIRREFDWLFAIHLARASVILMAMFLFRQKYLIAALALALSYIEIYPMRSLKILGGDQTLDDSNKERSRD